ncbi:MAG TPA: sulfite exporter TauE/SafE family protein [Verrucomicrobiae bacterium]|nr:sulfite exporter TauE/SafE family protein [Verrucomicrobiae bacterium]
MDLGSVTTPATALVAGLLTGIHCCGMCGPLTCAVFGGGGAGATGVLPSLASYHSARLVSYAVIGGLLGMVGGSLAGFFAGSVTKLLPWAFAVVFLFIGLGLEKRIPVPRVFSAFFGRIRIRAGGGAKMAGAIGLATPFLPCGPLYMVFGVALFSGSFLRGAALMAAFALGTALIFAFFQSQVLRLQGRFSPKVMGWIRQGFALVAAVVLALRAAADISLVGSGGSCPMCH